MKWTAAKRKAHGAKISASWARKRAEKEKAENDAKWKKGLGFKKEAWGKSIGLDPEDQVALNKIMRDAVDTVPPHLKVMDLKYNPHFEEDCQTTFSACPTPFSKYTTEDSCMYPIPEDMVNHPSHYTFSEYEVADVADAWYPDEPHLWNANKYMARWNKKGDPVENLEKAIWYLKRKLNLLKEGK